MAATFICGHLHPDTDSICSALAYESLKQALGEDAKAVRAGPLNPETSWVLDRFKSHIPPEIRDLRVQVQDVDLDKPDQVLPKTSLKQSWEQMNACQVKTLPIVDEEHKLIGVVTLGDIATCDLNSDTSRVFTLPSANLIENLHATVVGPLPESITATLHLHQHGKVPVSKSIVFCEDITLDLILQAARADVPCLVQCNTAPEIAAIQTEMFGNIMSSLKMTLLFTALNTFTAIRYAQQSLPISTAMSRVKPVYFPINAYLDEIKERMLTSRFRSYPIVDADNRVQGSISRYHLLQPRKKKVILVDHNEMSQCVRGIDQADVLEIIDHHRLGDIQTHNPVYFRNEPVGCTSTIIASLFFEREMTPPPMIAGLMLCAILSDTVMFKSPTCTSRDIRTAERLATIAGEDVQKLGSEMFKVGDTLLEKTPEELLFLDFKEFFLGDNKVGIGQVSCLEISMLAPFSKTLPPLMAEVCHQQRFDLLLFMETDIKNEGTRLYYAGHLRKELADAFDVELDGDSFFLPGVMSRKKQVIPAISAVLR
jgi:manganese-dependent inorganic pyrophosphatase